MTDRFSRAFALLRVHEGGYSDHPKDPGGRTMKGVTQRTYDAYRRRMKQPTRHVKEITDAEVERIYRGQYWAAVKADDLPEGVAYCVFDAAVNSGPGRAVRWLQEVIGAKVDGIVGDETVSAARGMDPAALINTYCDRRLAFMKRLKHWSSFKNGWSRRVSEVRTQAIEWATHNHVDQPTTEPLQPKAEGKESLSATIKDVVTDRGAIGAASGFLGSLGSLASGQGPVQYAIAAVFVLGALTAIWWIVKGREA